MDLKPEVSKGAGYKRGFIYLLFICFMGLSASAKADVHEGARNEFKYLIDQVYLLPVVKQKEEVKIAVVYPGLQASDYWQRSLTALRGRLDDLGILYKLDIRFSQPHTQLDLQEAHILEMLEHEPDYLVYTINSLRQQRMVEALLQRKEPKLIIQNLTRPIADWYDIQPLIYIGFDHVEGADKLAQYFKQRFSKGSEYGIIFWGKGVLSDQRGLTFERNVGSYHKLKASYYTQSRAQAKRSTLLMLKNSPGLKYIYACSTDAALGAVDALKELQRSDVAINGWGGGRAELDAFQEGLLDVVLMRVNDQNGIAMAEAIRLDMLDQPIPNVYAGDFRVLTQGMDVSLINRYIKEAFIYSGDVRK
ncbi:substrate-binding domain-containing protein [Neptunomonas japonica]|uniref:substrate-binding domain-containing protein n=1 Tax=Neptunomonas japonica TaxID=417574 RepID=UPI00068543BE|nr:substrate-binding domain-containing protein [Neptunomonas japonica]